MMPKGKSRSHSMAFLALILLLSAAWVGRQVPVIHLDIPKQESSLTIKFEFIKIVSLGMRRALADLHWVITLIESDQDHYAGKDLNSWMYHRFSTIQQLDPLFYANYRYGGQYLDIVKNDIDGAEEIYRKGIENYPTDFSLNWQMGFLQAIEKSNYTEAYQYFDRIKNDPHRPTFFDSMLARIAVKGLDQEEAFKLTYDTWARTADGTHIKKRLWEILYTLRARIDISCLKAQKSDCRKLDLEGVPYIHRDSDWSTPRESMNIDVHKPKAYQ